MKLFNFGKTPEKVDKGYFSFSTPFFKIGKGNLSLPYVNDGYKGTDGYIYFGSDNLYPQILNQIYYTSPLHSSICNFTSKAVTGGGFDFDIGKFNLAEQVDYKSFAIKVELNKLINQIALDLIIHGRSYFKVNKQGVKCRISPEKVRRNQTLTKCFISDDWSRRTAVGSINAYKFNSNNNEEAIYCYERYSIGQDVYTIPSYTSAMNWCFLDGEMSYLHKSNIQNSIFPSFALMFPKKFTTDEEKQQIKETIDKAKGGSEAGKVVVFSANGKEMLPELVPIPTNQNDKLFIETDEQINLKICQAHTIDPMLMGVRVSGKLGGGSDIKQSYIIWEKNTVMPLRMEVEEIINDLLFISGLKKTFKLNDFQIINETIVQK